MQSSSEILSAGRRARREKGYTTKDHRETNLAIGIDVGSVSSSLVVVDKDNNIVMEDYQRTCGRPVEILLGQFEKAMETFSPGVIRLTAATGSGGRLIAGLLQIPFVNEVPAQAAAVGFLLPELPRATVIEMGGQDSKLLFITRENGVVKLEDFTLNTACAAGTGSFLDQQAQRLGVDIEEQFGRLALACTSVPRMAGRCSVFAKSDMIHLQQQATPVEDIIAGLCRALARNLKSNLGSGRQFVKPVVFTGGVAANTGVVRALEDVLCLGRGGLLVPKQHFNTGAIGAVLVARGREYKDAVRQPDPEILRRYLARRGSALSIAPRRPALKPPRGRFPSGELFDPEPGPAEAFLGVDVGSISTNVVVMDGKRRVLAKAYLMTAGRPLEAVRKGLQRVGEQVSRKVVIAAVATTGSGRYLTGDFIGADLVINEITAQAAGAALVQPDVDTIFEIGGQDSKYIALSGGVVIDFEMNHACAAGTGSFLEEQAQRLGVKIDGEFSELAMKSRSPVKLGERCTVFMESDLLNYQQQGAEIGDLVAGLSYSIVANYLNRVVGRRKIGDKICFQGGTAFNRAVWSAFEQTLGKPVIVPDHHEVTGALGAAAIAADRLARARGLGRGFETRFRGFEQIAEVDYAVESFACEHCPNTCEIKRVTLPGSEPLYYGSRCDRYNIKKKKQSVASMAAFEFRERLLFHYAGIDRTIEDDRATVGLPLALLNWQFLPLFAGFFQDLGFRPVLSGSTNKRIIRLGIEAVTSQPCFPVKVAFGHVCELLEKNLDFIFLPSVVSMPGLRPGTVPSQLCPYVQSFPYQILSAFAGEKTNSRIITAEIRAGDGRRRLAASFATLAAKMGCSRRAWQKAFNLAMNRQDNFERDLKAQGRKILSDLKEDERLFVLVGRPYNTCDQGVNLAIASKLAEHGVRTIPLDMLDLESAFISDADIHGSVYWTSGQKILRAAEIIKADPRLFAVYISNFGCGPDSFLMTLFRDIMHSDSGGKPCLQLEVDEHSADAGLVTRIEAFLESLKNHRPVPAGPPRTRPAGGDSGLRSIYIPYMGDCAHGLAAAIRAYGRRAEVMPLADEDSLLAGRAFTTGKECLPCAITAGDMLKVAGREGFDPRSAAFFMPSGSGPCRFGMYNCLHKQILKYAGLEAAEIIAPNQDSGFYRQMCVSVGRGRAFLKHSWNAMVAVDLLFKLLLRLRPFTNPPQAADRVYESVLAAHLKAVESGWGLGRLCGLMAQAADRFAQLPMDRDIRKPRVGIVGEIYVRNHPFANRHLIRQLEQLGACCELASLAEWIHYTNFTRTAASARAWKMADLATNVLQGCIQRRLERALARPLERVFGRLLDEPINHTLKLARPYLLPSFEGEAILSVGKIVEFYRAGFSGVVNVMPFGCMPSTVVSGQSMTISRDCGCMPILNVTFDGQEDATLITRLEAFVEQVAHRRTAHVTELLV